MSRNKQTVEIRNTDIKYYANISHTVDSIQFDIYISGNTE